MTHLKRVAITTGDRNGVGFEVTAKALHRLTPSNKKNHTVFFLFRHRLQEITQPQYFKLLDKKWFRKTFTSLQDALTFVNSPARHPDNLLIDLSLESSAAEWVVQAATACKRKKLTALITGPLSKRLTAAMSEKVLGHTGIFRQLFPKKKLYMSFVGKYFNVILATDHIPLGAVEAQLKKDTLKPVLQAALGFRSLIGSKKNVAVLGFNPHSGESGLIGNIEKSLFVKVPRGVVGPIVPDAAFFKKNWNAFSVFVCLYHDQGLIPFKMQHGQDSGVQLTLGLPFVRTSVDHGTAFDLFNKNVANSNSMLEAIKLGIQLSGA